MMFQKKKNHTLNSVLVVHFIPIKLLFLFMVNNTTNALISVDVHVCTIALPLLPSCFYPLPLSVPHCQCREHSHSYRPQRGNTQQTRKMTASAISFSEGLQVRQEMAIIPSTLSVLSYFLL